MAKRVGRPSKYKSKYCKMLIEDMESGYSFEAFAGKIDVNVDTLHEWCKRHQEFSDAKQLAYAKSRRYWEKVGLDGLQSTVMRKGNMTITKSLNVRVWEMNLKSKFKDWRNLDKADVQINQDNRGDRLIIKMDRDDEKESL